MKLYSPRNLSDFKRIPKKHRNGQTPETMFQKHSKRLNERTQRFILNERDRPKNLAQWLKNRNDYATPPIQCVPIYYDGAVDEPIKLNNERKKNWSSPKATTEKTHVKTINNGSYSKRCTWTRYSYVHMVESWAYLLSSTLIYCRIHTKSGIQKITLKSPRGWIFSADKNGLLLQKISNKKIEVHIDASSIIRSKKYWLSEMNRVKSIAISLYKVRKEQEKKSKIASMDQKKLWKFITKADRDGVMVCFRDSYNAGNCIAGTEQFIARCNLNPHCHVKPSYLFRLAESTSSIDRVKLAIFYAIERHKREMSLGFSVLHDHYRKWSVQQVQMVNA